MLANFLNKSKPINFIGLLVFFYLCYIISIYTAFLSNDLSFDNLLKSVLFVILYLIVFFFYNFIISKNNLTLDNSFAYYNFTVLVICVLPVLTTYKTLILVIIYFLLLRKIYSLKSSKAIIQKLFDAGFWLGILFILEPLTILFSLLIVSGIYLHQKITIHTIFTPIIGFLSPLFIYFVYFFWIDKIEVFTNLFELKTSFDFGFYLESKYYWFLVVLFIFSFVSLVFKSLKTLPVSNTFRKSWVLIFINFIIALLFVLLYSDKDGSEILFILFPVSVIIANGIELITKKVYKNILLYLFLFGSIFFCFFL